MHGKASPLNNLKVASPCSADWNTMYGSERKRFCGDCKLNVYNLAAMSVTEAEELLMRSEGRLCVRYYRRADGTILTEDCPVGWARVKRRVSRVAAAALTLILTAIGGIFMTTVLSRKKEIVGRIIPTVKPTPDAEPLMGAIAIPTPAATPTPKPATPKKWRVVTLTPIAHANEKAA